MNSDSKISAFNSSNNPDPSAEDQKGIYFIAVVLGFSFWFFMAVPFASHRESYWWLAMVQSEPFAKAFGIISSTYRPLAQGATWSAFLILHPSTFPTSVLLQALLQGFIYGMFVLAWWLIFSRAPQRRLFALVACIAGGVFFSGYVHLFHLYGLFYVPVMLTLGGLLRLYGAGTFEKREVWFAVVATLLAFWHPFATALFVGFYFGYYLDTFSKRDKAQHAQAVVILLVSTIAIAALVVLFPRTPMPLDTRLAGFLISYKTNEVNLVASAVAFLLTQAVILGMGLSPRVKLTAFLLASALSVVFVLKGLPLLLLWLSAVLVKLVRLRCWQLFFLTLTASLLPFGGAIGAPMYALFAIILAVYVTPLGCLEADRALAVVKPRYIWGAVLASMIAIVAVRAGIKVPILTRLANPLLSERERTYQMENILDWLHKSEYCGDALAFAENAGSPIDSVESATSRRYRPPAWPPDIQLYWTTVLQCRGVERPNTNTETAVVTFGGQPLSDLRPVFKVDGKYAGDATVWIRNPQK